MNDYRHRITIAVPESFISAANQLALIAGESPDVVNTFTHANWQDIDGNLYAVCSTVVKPIVLELLGQSVANSKLTDDNANKLLAQKALDAVVIFSDGITVNIDKIVVAIDIAPLTALEQMGLSLADNLEQPI